MKFLINILINALLVAFINLRGKRNRRSRAQHLAESVDTLLSQVDTFVAATFWCGTNYSTSFVITVDVTLLQTPGSSYGAKGIVVTGVPSTNNCSIFYTESSTTYLSYRLLGNSTSEYSTYGANITSYYIYNNAPMPVKIQFAATTTPNATLVTYLGYINTNKLARQASIKGYKDNAIKAINLYQMYINNTLKNKTWELNYLRAESERWQYTLDSKKITLDTKKSEVYSTEVRITKANDTINKNKVKSALATKTLTQAQTELTNLANVKQDVSMANITTYQTNYFYSLAVIKSRFDIYMEEAANRASQLKRNHQYMTKRNQVEFETWLGDCLQ
jgi:hypothetical protein